MRALLCTAVGSSSEQGAAAKTVEDLLRGDQNAATLAPAYLSASIDALQSWRNSASSTPWLTIYQGVLQAFVPKPELVEPPPANNALCYLVLDIELTMAGRRRLVYLSDSDRVYGHPQGESARTLSLDWATELDNGVLVTSDPQGRDILSSQTLRELISGNPMTLYRTFERAFVWAIGNYPPLQF